ncbi:MAG: LysM peptidoglycan-binding domain-containing protein [Halofilum sp. (in: g-proteobacteria)]
MANRLCRGAGLVCALTLMVGGCASRGPADSAADADPVDGERPADLRAAVPTETIDGVVAAEPEDEPLLSIDTPLVPQSLGDDAEAAAEPQDIWGRVRGQFRIEPPADAEPIQAEIRRYTGRQAYFDAVVSRGEPYLHYIVDRLEARDLPTELLLVPVVESTFRPFAYSYSRAGGIWQFTPATGRHYGLAQNWWYDGRRDVVASTEAALDYLEYLHGLFDGDWLLAMAAYNAGEGRVQRAVQRNEANGRPTDFWNLPLPQQTRKYVPRILALRAILAAPQEHGIELPSVANEAALTLVELPGQVDVALAAKMADISVDRLYRYNPGFNRWATPPDGPHRLAVPRARAEAFEVALAEQDPDDMVRWKRHQVASGETLSAIADTHGVSVDALQDVNEIDGAFIRAGDHLLVPSASQPAEDYALSASNRRRARQARGPENRRQIEYQVQSGDTLWELARSHEVPVRRLASWNDMAPADLLRPGDRLVVWVERGNRGGPGHDGPSERLQRVDYTVRRGDSLYDIAQRFGLRVADIERWNELDGEQYLQPGQQLELRVDVTAQAEAS